MGVIGEQHNAQWIKNVIIDKDLRATIITQCTGLKDKKGEDVYEGDVFRSHNEDEEGNETTVHSVVSWIKERAAFYLIKNDHYSLYASGGMPLEDAVFDSDQCALYDFSIDVGLHKAGNIFENPELLKA